MRPMSDERAIENAIVSTQMEGFEVTESDKKLLMKIIKKEIINRITECLADTRHSVER